MSTISNLIIENGYSDRILTEMQVSRIAGGSSARIHGLVHRAIKSGDLLRIERGLYVLNNSYRQKRWHPFTVSQALCAGSYVSMESALAYHGWLPEAVPAILSITPYRKKKKTLHPILGAYYSYPLALNLREFYQEIERERFGNQTVFVASPGRALMDLICFRKVEWQGLDWVTDGLRIDLEDLCSAFEAFQLLVDLYKQNRTKWFLDALIASLKPLLSEYEQNK